MGLVTGSTHCKQRLHRLLPVAILDRFLTLSIILRKVDFKTPRNAVYGYVLAISLFHAVQRNIWVRAKDFGYLRYDGLTLQEQW
jgi:hypothetical protein